MLSSTPSHFRLLKLNLEQYIFSVFRLDRFSLKGILDELTREHFAKFIRFVCSQKMINPFLTSVSPSKVSPASHFSVIMNGGIRHLKHWRITLCIEDTLKVAYEKFPT